MKRFGLAFKIWMAMLALVVLVLGLSAVFQSSLIAQIYIRLQADRIVESATSLASEIDLHDRSEVDKTVSALAGALNASVTVIDSDASVISWSGRGGGMGMGMGWGAMMGGRMRGGGPGLPVETSDVQAALGGETLIKKGASRFWGTDVLLVGIPVKSDGSIAGAVFVQSPMASIEANIKAIRESVLYSLLLGLAAASLLAFVFSKKVSRPILKLNEAARSMAGGNFDIKIPLKSGDELGMLADSINTLSCQLKEKIKTIEEIDSTRRSFVANISHELRTPLTIIQGYTEALMDGIASDEQQKEKYLYNIYGETVRLSRLVNDVLDLRRMETGQLSMRAEEIDIMELIKSVAGQFQGVFPGISLKLPDLPGGETLKARVDPDRIKQVIINLVDNAVRYSPEGGTIEISGEGLADRVRVSVADQGPGVPEKERELIWERFYKTSESPSGREYSGSGLGLAIARQIIEQHGGKIGVENLPGKGSQFWFTVKRA